jgi:hypothetical protein
MSLVVNIKCSFYDNPFNKNFIIPQGITYKPEGFGGGVVNPKDIISKTFNYVE